MGNNQASKRVTARRAATFLAAIGALVMSSGIALMVTATSANAVAEKPSVCHPVNGKGELGNGWDLIPPDKASSHIDESLYPDGVYWKHEAKDGRHDIYAVEGECPGEPVEDVTCPDDATAHAGEVVPDGEDPDVYCTAEVTPPELCPEDATANAGQEIPEGQTAEEFCNAVVSPPTLCPEDATANAGVEIPEGQTAEEFCTADTVVSPPTVVVSTPTKTKSTTVTPTVVHAGLAGATVQDMRGEQGLALVFGGMVMMVAAGGLGLRLRGSAARI
jgi:hypothetical protein